MIWLAAGLVACLSERPRPAPPTITVTLDKATVASQSNPPDTLVVTVRATDADGIDSAWVQLDDDPPQGADGFLEPVLEVPFRLLVPPGLSPGHVLSVKIRARDVAGFEGERDTSVAVGP